MKWVILIALIALFFVIARPSDTAIQKCMEVTGWGEDRCFIEVGR